MSKNLMSSNLKSSSSFNDGINAELELDLFSGNLRFDSMNVTSKWSCAIASF